MNPWNKAFREVESSGEVKNLIDTNFHRAGWHHRAEALEPLWSQYLESRCYSPHPKGSLSARESLVKFYQKQQCPVTLSPEDFFLTASTSEAYSLLFHLLCQTGDTLLLPKPGYPLFEHLGNLARTTCAYYHLEYPGWRLTLESLEKAWTPGCKVLVLISPHNPTGRVFTQDEVNLALDFCENKNLALVWDEVFDPWLFLPEDKHLPRPWQVHPRIPVFLLNGISKRFASADLKLGWIGVQGPASWKKAFLETLEVANDTLLSCNSFSQALLPWFFENSAKLLETMTSQAAENREIIHSELGNYCDPLPEGGLHCVLNFPDCPWDDETLAVKLLKKGYALHPGYFYDLPGCRLVLSLVHEPGVFKRCIRGLKEVLRELV